MKRLEVLVKSIRRLGGLAGVDWKKLSLGMVVTGVKNGEVLRDKTQAVAIAVMC